MRRNRTHRRLDNHLTLHAWLNGHFGYRTTNDLLTEIQRLDEGFTPDGHSLICEYLMSRQYLPPAIEASLSTYDANIKRHLSAINTNRSQPIVLRYFQYLALLYTEIFLDWKINKPGELLRQLNAFVHTGNAAKPPGDPMDTPFTETDIEKLAFWMATGAGKTLIMHINYHQYLYYRKDKLDNIVLITPNEGLSEQHRRELHASDISCERFNVDGNHSSNNDNTLRIIEIHKIVEERRGSGVSVPVEAFEGNNLIFVDEGHKGSGGKAWRQKREELAEKGFTFEYSATFGQALAASSNADLIDEYGKSIVFDYSYRYFYGDGYGKNFRIINVKDHTDHHTQRLLLANLLSFYEQKRCFNEIGEAVHVYGLDSPLWTFVGSSVKAKVVYTDKGRLRSDILDVIQFLHRFLKNENNWVISTIEKILTGNSGLLDDNRNDLFHNRLNYLKESGNTSEQIYDLILNEVFHTQKSGALHLCDVRNAPGEIALKATQGRDYFGLINIGDAPNFKKLVENDDDIDIIIEVEDVFAESLFTDINNPQSPINILIGAKKFIEGWDSWRVTAMGLLNVGRTEGSQIIQLFGRGVRLRGRDMSLKRSTSSDTERPSNLPLLETLNIFAVRANFMVNFEEYLMREGVPHKEPIEIDIPIVSNLDSVPRKLLVPKAPQYKKYAEGQCVLLEAKDSEAFSISHTTQILDVIGSRSQEGIQAGQAGAALKTHIKLEILECVDWESIYLHILEYKQEKGFHNLVFDADVLKEILNPEKGLYELSVVDESEVTPTSMVELKRLEELILTLLRKYIAKFYRIIVKQWNDGNMELCELDGTDDNFTNWKVSVSQNDTQGLTQHITRLIETGEIYGGRHAFLGSSSFLIVYYERHLYQPLIAASKTNPSWFSSPPALVESEREFVEHLKQYVEQQPQQIIDAKGFYLLRNQSRGKGIGFYENEGFYPDFILWIISEENKQRIVFIEPHGMAFEQIDERNPKINLFRRLRKLSSDERFREKNVELDSFIISKTHFNRLRHNIERRSQQELAVDYHILFPDDVYLEYLSPIFNS